MIKEFASLHGHSHFSVFDGLSLPEEMLLAAKQKGLKSIALTDHGVTHGHADFYLHAKKIGIKAIFGVEAYLIHSLDEWKEMKEKHAATKKGKAEVIEYADDGDIIDSKMLRRKGHLVILACNREGLSNLYQLTYKSHKYGFYGKPRMDKEMLREHARGLVASSACMGGVIAKRLWDFKAGESSWDDVKQEVLEYDAIFGRGRFFLEVQFNEMEEQNYINSCLVRLSDETGVPLTVTTDSHYSKQEEWEPRELLHLMGWSKRTVQDFPNGKLDSKVRQLYVKSPEEMWETYMKYGSSVMTPAVAQRAFEGSLMMDSLVDDYEPDTHQRLPTLPYVNPFKELGERAIAGLRQLGLAERDEYKQRLLFELNVIKQKGISNYFLVCSRFINEARKVMLVGPGRGSAPGSLVCWTLGITDYDPVSNGLLFERFLDLDRVELPDIDSDFEDPAAAKEIVKQIFGEDNVASLTSYGTFQIKGLLKDLGRAYGLDHNNVNKVNRQIEKELRVLYKDNDKSTLVIKLDDLERVSPAFNSFVEENPELGSHIKALYGRIRHVSRHAAGVIIGDNLPAETSCFVRYDKKEGTAVQCSFTEGIVNKNLSAMGFVKFDFLGLANLRTIHHALLLLAEKTGRTFEDWRESMRAHRLDLNDIKVMEHVFWKGNLAGIFQFTNPGIRALAKKVRPDSFVDISAIVSLYRPGPLKGKYDETYVQAKRNADSIKYEHPILEEILGPTKGCLIFQEQIMQVCGKLGKMSGKDVNRVRKVLLKKDKTKTEEFIKKENDELYAKFVAGCKENGFPDSKVLKLWDDIKAFGGYAFNKAHSDVYSLTTMQTAYLATYHPMEFYAALLTCAQAGKFQEVVSDIQKTGVKILPIDINRSYKSHTIEGDKIRLSLSTIDGIGPAVVTKILAGQPYVDFPDFLERSKVGKGAIEPLIKAGAFSELPLCGNMRRLEMAYFKWTENESVDVTDPKSGKVKQAKLQSVKGKPYWQDIFEKTVNDADINDYGLHEKILFENELQGFSLVGSPFEVLGRAEKIEKMFSGVISSYSEFIESDESTAMLPVVIKSWNERPQRNGKMFAFMRFGTPEGLEFEAPAFANIWTHIGQKVRKGAVYVATFNRDIDDNPEGLKVGRAGFAHSAYSIDTSFVNVDEIT